MLYSRLSVTHNISTYRFTLIIKYNLSLLWCHQSHSILWFRNKKLLKWPNYVQSLMWPCTKMYIFSVFDYINRQSRNTFTSLLSIIALTWNTLAWFTAQVCSKHVRNVLVNNVSVLFHPYKSGAKGTAYSRMESHAPTVTFNTFIATNDELQKKPRVEAHFWFFSWKQATRGALLVRSSEWGSSGCLSLLSGGHARGDRVHLDVFVQNVFMVCKVSNYVKLSYERL